MTSLPNDTDRKFADIMRGSGIDEQKLEDEFMSMGLADVIKAWGDIVDATVGIQEDLKQFKKRLFDYEDIMTKLINKSIEPERAIEQLMNLIGMKIEIQSDSFGIYDALDTITHMQLQIMASIDDFNGELLSRTYECLTFARLMRLSIRELPGDHSEELEQINQKSKLLQL